MANIVTTYDYETNGSNQTTRLATENINGVKYTYDYDDVGNIIGIYIGDNVPYRAYTYDSLGQLKVETRYDEGIYVENTYNHLGNIRFREVYEIPESKDEEAVLLVKYTYNYSKDTDAGWNYLLTSIVTTDYVNGTNTTETIDYDAIGNPTTYRGASLAFNGRQLTSYTKGSTSISYTYDASGLRASKTVNGETTIYQYVGDKLYYEQRSDGSKHYYFYDSYGNLAKIYRHTSLGQKVYNVVTNAQGDVIALYDFAGVLVCTYEYDAWGNLTSVKNANGAEITSQNHIAFLNPIRYRGYYFDNEIGMYYLQSRYYDPDTGRFINSDGLISDIAGPVLGCNTFAYCLNDPINRIDSNGCWFEDALAWAEDTWESAKELGEKVVDGVSMVANDIWTGLSNDTEDLVYIEQENGDVEIVNSYTVWNPIVMYRYLRENRDDEDGGSTVGVMYEWYCHNLGYEAGKFVKYLGFDFGKGIMDSGENVYFGSTIYNDTEHEELSKAMHISYFLLCPHSALYDLVIYLRNEREAQ